MVRALPRIPGTKEVRYEHVFGEESPAPDYDPAPMTERTGRQESESLMEKRLSALEERVATLERLIDDLTS